MGYLLYLALLLFLPHLLNDFDHHRLLSGYVNYIQYFVGYCLSTVLVLVL